MRFLSALIFALCLVACAPDDVPKPYQCRNAGVQVSDNTPITGSIVKSTWMRDDQKIKMACRQPFSNSFVFYGCVIPVNTHEYQIVYYDDLSRMHEECHALYEIFVHVPYGGAYEKGIRH